METTPTSPVGAEDLALLEHLQMSRQGIANRLLDLREEEIRLLAAAKRVSDEFTAVMHKIASERGIDPNSPLSVNPTTGEVHVDPPPKP